MQLTEKYRPRRLGQIVGQDKAVATVRRIIGRRGWDRDVIWIEGPTGTGKTTLARALAAELGAGDWSVEEIDGDQCTVEAVRRLGETVELGMLGGSGWRVWIVNEAQAMTARAIQAWLTLLERLPARRLIVFTTTVEDGNLFGEFSDPFMGRVMTIRLTKIGLRETFARLAYGIARREQLNGRPRADYLHLVAECHNSMRMVLRRIERGDMVAPVQHSPAIKKMMAGGRRARARRQRTTKDTKSTKSAKRTARSRKAGR